MRIVSTDAKLVGMARFVTANVVRPAKITTAWIEQITALTVVFRNTTERFATRYVTVTATMKYARTMATVHMDVMPSGTETCAQHPALRHARTICAIEKREIVLLAAIRIRVRFAGLQVSTNYVYQTFL